MDDNDQSHNLTDFPNEPVIHLHLLSWFLLFLIAAGLVTAFLYIYSRGRIHSRQTLAATIRVRVRSVFDSLKLSASASGDALVPAAQSTLDTINSNFAATLKLSNELSKRIDRLNKALDGSEEKEAEGHSLFPGANLVPGGTVINIAVNQGAVSAAGDAAQNHGSGAHAAHAETALAGKLLTQEGLVSGVWKAVQKLYDYWKNDNAVIAAFTAAQQQLLNQTWDEPRPELPLLSDVLARKRD